MEETPTQPEEESEEEKEKQRRFRFHRLMGMLIRESFKDFPIEIDTETDVSEVEQRIDIVVKLTNDAPPPVIADGIERLKPHNLFTFKSFRESLTVESIEELIGYTVGYKKYDLRYGSTHIQLIVIHELKSNSQNANFLLFSNKVEQVQYGKKNHTLSKTRYTSLIRQLVERHKEEGDENMAELLLSEEDELLAEIAQIPAWRKKLVEKASPKERIAGLSPEARVQEDFTDALSEGLSPEQLEILAKRLAEKAKRVQESQKTS